MIISFFLRDVWKEYFYWIKSLLGMYANESGSFYSNVFFSLVDNTGIIHCGVSEYKPARSLSRFSSTIQESLLANMFLNVFHIW